MYITAFNEYDKEFFCKSLSIYPTSEFRGIKGVMNGAAVVGVGMDNWTPNSVMMHIAITNPKYFTRQFAREVFKYVFITTAKGVAIGVTPCNNIAALEFNKRIGFVEISRVKDGYALGTDSAIQVMRREQCRWINHLDDECQRAPQQPRIIQQQPRPRAMRLNS